jgi:hypothetical protein
MGCGKHQYLFDYDPPNNSCEILVDNERNESFAHDSLIYHRVHKRIDASTSELEIELKQALIRDWAQL